MKGKSSEKSTARPSGRDLSDAYGYISLVFEFLGILALLPILGYMADAYFIPGRGPWFFISGVIVGFIHGVIHLYRRSQSIARQNQSRVSYKEQWNREGYERNLDGRLDDLRRGLDEVGQKINQLGPTRPPARPDDDSQSGGTGR